MRKSKKNREILHVLPVDRIWPSPYGSRSEFDSEGIRALAESLSRFGMISPLLVRECGGEYELIAGERRLRAARLLEWKTVPCRVLSASPRLTAALSLEENLQRESLDCFQEALALDKMRRRFEEAPPQLAARLGRTPSGVAFFLRLLRFSQKERILLRRYGVSKRHCDFLLRLDTAEKRSRALSKLIEGVYSQKEADRYLSRLLEDFDDVTARPVLCEAAPLRRFVPKDLRFFLNSVDRAIGGIREAGFFVDSEKNEQNGEISYVIHIKANLVRETAED